MNTPIRMLLPLVALTAALLSSAEDSKVTLQIQVPANGNSVSEIQTVEGAVSDPEADVVVVVHPVADNCYWVQSSATVNTDGKWRVHDVHFGQGALGVGEKFEIRAFIAPKDRLQPGQKLKTWPAAAARSNVVEVIRR